MDYRFGAGTNGLSLSVSNAAVQLTALQLKATDTSETVVSIPSFSVEQAEANLLQRSARVHALKSAGGSFLAVNAPMARSTCSLCSTNPARAL